MKSWLSRALAVVAGGVLLTLAVSAGAGTGASSQTHLARGVVKAVSDARLVLDTSQGPSKSEMVLALDDKTIVQRGVGRPISVKDLRAGDAVTVSYAGSQAKAVARRIWVRVSGDAVSAAPARGNGTKGR